ncbi:ornithine carbamoyltransferase [Dictyobacter sp. S3.2.2.5]|uniref:Ornithine carbamoyltransferase n=1 Tax=Dictyobacter halimunensis TaxID=3026934 RepID=A0ABQ6FH31_9CHLR|nr:ornithine carbamoyltransferase [Dictyobacter sp. S3.2.2.5]
MVDRLKKDRAFELAEQRFAERLKRKPRSFISLQTLTPLEMKTIMRRGIEMKNRLGDFSQVLHGMSIALLFQKTSTRTRCSFEKAAVELGAFPSYIDWKTSNFVLADLSDEIKVLSRYHDLIVVRALHHEMLVTMAQESEVPIINGMCDREHPCQVLADFMTITEYFGENLDGLRIAYLGDGNNVCRSLVHGAIHMGVQVNLCSPERYALDDETVAAGKGLITRMTHPLDAVHDADVIYTDTWVSIGDEAETQERLAAFEAYQVNDQLLAFAPSQVLFMHCLPAHPGQEVTPEILRSPRSLVFDQAENRRHAQKALLEWLVHQ